MQHAMSFIWGALCPLIGVPDIECLMSFIWRSLNVMPLMAPYCLGGLPYNGVRNKEILNHLKRGHRLEKPGNCSQEL